MVNTYNSSKKLNKMFAHFLQFITFSLAAISTLYFLEHNKQHYYSSPADLLQFSSAQNVNRGYGQNIYNSYTGRDISTNIRLHQRKPSISYSDRVIPLSDDAIIQYNSSNIHITPIKEGTGDAIATVINVPSALADPITSENEHTHQFSEAANVRRAKGQRHQLITKAIITNFDSASETKESHDSNNVDPNGPIITEHNDLNHVITDNSYLLTDVDTNLIDVGQTGIRDDSKF